MGTGEGFSELVSRLRSSRYSDNSRPAVWNRACFGYGRIILEAVEEQVFLDRGRRPRGPGAESRPSIHWVLSGMSRTSVVIPDRQLGHLREPWPARLRAWSSCRSNIRPRGTNTCTREGRIRPPRHPRPRHSLRVRAGLRYRLRLLQSFRRLPGVFRHHRIETTLAIVRHQSNQIGLRISSSSALACSSSISRILASAVVGNGERHPNP